jgi:hypothetical protein
MIIKTFVLEVGTEADWPVNTTDQEHTFGCFTLEEAIRDVVRNAIQGVPSRIVATPEWEAAHGPLRRDDRDDRKGRAA